MQSLLVKHQNIKKNIIQKFDWWYNFAYQDGTDIDFDNDEDLKAKEWLSKRTYINIWKQKTPAIHLFNYESSDDGNEYYL